MENIVYQHVFTVTQEVLDLCQNDEQIKEVLDRMAAQASSRLFQMVKTRTACCRGLNWGEEEDFDED